jgi:hypothetical protein
MHVLPRVYWLHTWTVQSIVVAKDGFVESLKSLTTGIPRFLRAPFRMQTLCTATTRDQMRLGKIRMDIATDLM